MKLGYFLFCVLGLLVSCVGQKKAELISFSNSVVTEPKIDSYDFIFESQCEYDEANDLYVKDLIAFDLKKNKKETLIINNAFLDESCNDLLFTAKSYGLGKTFKTDVKISGQYQIAIQISLLKEVLVINNFDLLESFNEQAMCGFKDWTFQKEKSIMGSDCGTKYLRIEYRQDEKYIENVDQLIGVDELRINVESDGENTARMFYRMN